MAAESSERPFLQLVALTILGGLVGSVIPALIGHPDFWDRVWRPDHKQPNIEQDALKQENETLRKEIEALQKKVCEISPPPPICSDIPPETPCSLQVIHNQPKSILKGQVQLRLDLVKQEGEPKDRVSKFLITFKSGMQKRILKQLHKDETVEFYLEDEKFEVRALSLSVLNQSIDLIIRRL